MKGTVARLPVMVIKRAETQPLRLLGSRIWNQSLCVLLMPKTCTVTLGARDVNNGKAELSPVRMLMAFVPLTTAVTFEVLVPDNVPVAVTVAL